MPPAPSTRPSIRVRFHFPYRGDTKEWSTRLHFAGNLTPTDAEFVALWDDVKDWFQGLVSTRTTIQGFVGYHPGSEVPVFSHSDVITGNADLSTDDRSCPGDCAMLLRFATDARTSKNHPIYLFNYLHDAWHVAGDPDTLSNQQHVVLGQFGTYVLDGSWSDGTNVLHRCGPYGAVAQSRLSEPLITHRDFPR